MSTPEAPCASREPGLCAACSPAFALAGLLALAAPAFAAGDITVKEGANFTPVSIAITPMIGDDAKIGAVVASDLARSVFLQPIDPGTFPEQISNPEARPNFDAWKTVNAQFVLTGAVHHQGGKVVAEYRLWDVATGEQIAGQQYRRRRLRRAPGVASDRRRCLRENNGLQRVLRLPRRLRAGERAEERAREEDRRHGHGRRECQDAHGRPFACGHAALFAERA